MSGNAETEPNESELLAAALELPPDRRDAYLDRACKGRAALKDRVLRLLRNASSSDDFMQAPALDLSTADSIDAIDVGRQIGRYRLMEQIGEGGMGVVYVALQSEPIARKVALKVIKPGMDSKSVIARFEAERQALALMDHPHIAKVFDAGTTSGRLPYFVMELVRGMAITAYCDQAKASIDDRLRLFRDVCAAVQHAHQKGIIHRDLKPSNILVTLNDGKPVVKVIDFGVAKALHTPIAEQAVYTALHQVLGTPLYMSPEQLELSGIDIDTRSDIYSLGVLLYELLSGKLPFERERLLGSGFDEMRRIIREEDPPRPSQRITTLPKAEQSTVAETRGLDERELPKTIRNELDWISLKALARDRNRRYQTPSELAEDLRRYLDDVPVLACPPSYRYLAGKFCRRHRRLIVSASLLAVSLVVGTVVSVSQAARAIRAEHDLGEQLALVTVEQTRTRRALDAVSLAESKQRELRQAAEDSAAQAALAAESERGLREQAEAAVRLARWNLYVAELASLRTALEERNFGRIDALLRGSVPASGEVDYRGWEWHYLERCARDASNRPAALDGEVPRRRLAFSPVADELAVLTETGLVEIRDSKSLERLARFDVQVQIDELSWSPDGTQLALGTHDFGELIVLDRSDGRRVWRSQPIDHRSLKPDGRRVGGMAWSSDGRRIAIGLRSGDIAIVDLQTRTTVAIRSADEMDLLEALDWHPDQERLLVGLRLGKRLVLDVTDRSTRELDYLSDVIGDAVAWNPSGALLATGEGRKVRIASPDDSEAIVLEGHSSGITDLAWVDDRRCISVARDRTARLWDVETGQVERVWFPADEPLVDVSIDRSGSTMAVASNSGVRIIAIDDSPKTFRRVTLPGTVDELQWSPDGRRIYVNGLVDFGGRWIGSMALLDGTTLRPLGTAINERGRGFRWTPDSTLIVQALDGGQWQVGDPRTAIGFQRLRKATTYRAYSAWSPDGSRVVAGDDRSPPILLDGRTGAPLREWSLDPVHAMTRGAWDPLASRFLTAGRSQPILLHVDGRSVGYPTMQSFDNGGIDWHPSGLVFALGNDQGTISIRDPERLEPIVFLNGHSADIRGLDFSPDGTRLASASLDGTVRLWDVATGQELFRLSLPDTPGFSSVCWSPDGRQLAAGTVDRSVVLFGPAEPGASALGSALPTHGAVFDRFRSDEAVDRLRRSVPGDAVRPHLERLLRRLEDVGNPSSLDLFAMLELWLAPEVESPSSIGDRIEAVIRSVDAIADDRIALEVGRTGLRLLDRHAGRLEPRDRRSFENELHFVLTHRIARSAESSELPEALAAAIETLSRDAGEADSDSVDWYRRLSLETLKVQDQVERHVRGLAEPDGAADTDALKQTLRHYEEFLGRFPSQAMPLDAPLDARSIRDAWVREVCEAEIRFDRAPTFGTDWPDAIEREILERSDVSLFYLAGLSRLTVGDVAGHQQLCRKLLERFAESNDPNTASLVVWTACMAPSAFRDFDALLALYRKAGGETLIGVELGALYLRRGDLDLARETLSKLIELEKPDQPGTGIETRYLLASVEAESGNHEAARRWADEAERMVAERMAAPGAFSKIAWTIKAQWKLLRDESDRAMRETEDDRS